MEKVYLLDGALIKVGEWDLMECFDENGALVATNPLPDGAVCAVLPLATTAKGSIVLASDYESLRRDEYPPIRDQLDALWKGGEHTAAMSEIVQAVKDKYPKP